MSLGDSRSALEAARKILLEDPSRRKQAIRTYIVQAGVTRGVATRVIEKLEKEMQIDNSASAGIICSNCKMVNNAKNFYCSRCGNQLAGSPQTMGSFSSSQWEYKDFVLTFPKTGAYCRLGSGAYSLIGAKQEFWSLCQGEIYEQLQEWLDEGWQPVGEVGPSAITCREYTSAKMGVFGWIFTIILVFFTFGLNLLFIWHTYAEPTGVRIKMRRARAR